MIIHEVYRPLNWCTLVVLYSDSHCRLVRLVCHVAVLRVMTFSGKVNPLKVGQSSLKVKVSSVMIGVQLVG